MATYQIQETSASGQTRQRTLSDEEALAYFSPQVTLSANKTTIAADEVDFATVTVQLKSVPLSNNQQQNLALVHKVVLLVAEVEVELTTDANGQVTHDIAARDAGAYTVRTLNLNSNTLTITAN